MFFGASFYLVVICEVMNQRDHLLSKAKGGLGKLNVQSPLGNDVRPVRKADEARSGSLAASLHLESMDWIGSRAGAEKMKLSGNMLVLLRVRR